MKRILELVLVPLITLTFASVSFAQPAPVTPVPVTPAPITPATPTPGKKAVKKEPKTATITGEITSVDAKAGTLTLKVNGKEMSFVPETKGAKSALKKVKVGEQVRVSYSEKDGTLSARSVTEAKAKTMAKAKTKARKKTQVKGMEKKAEKKEEPKSEKK